MPRHARENDTYQNKTKKSLVTVTVDKIGVRKEHSSIVGKNVKWFSLDGKQYEDSSHPTKEIELSYDPAIPLLDIYSPNANAFI